MEETWYEATNNYTGVTEKYSSFDEIRPLFSVIDRSWNYGIALVNLESYRIVKCHSYKDGLFKKSVDRNDLDRHGYTMYYKTKDLKTITEGWVEASELEQNLIENISKKNDKIFKRWIYSRNKNNIITMYVSPEDLAVAKQMLTTPLDPFVIKGSDWPYWFKVNDICLSSKTSSWFKYLYDNYKIMVPNWLEKYTGPDKEKEYNEKMEKCLDK